MNYVYILRCNDGSLYVGQTTDVAQRIAAHNKGRGAAYTFKRRPVRAVYIEPHSDKPTADRRERQLKKWSHAKKLALISGDLRTLHNLSRSRDE